METCSARAGSQSLFVAPLLGLYPDQPGTTYQEAKVPDELPHIVSALWPRRHVTYAQYKEAVIPCIVRMTYQNLVIHT